MATSEPTFAVVGNGELSDAAIEALATLLLSLAEQDATQKKDQEEHLKSA